MYFSLLDFEKFLPAIIPVEQSTKEFSWLKFYLLSDDVLVIGGRVGQLLCYHRPPIIQSDCMNINMMGHGMIGN